MIRINCSIHLQHLKNKPQKRTCALFVDQVSRPTVVVSTESSVAGFGNDRNSFSYPTTVHEGAVRIGGSHHEVSSWERNEASTFRSTTEMYAGSTSLDEIRRQKSKQKLLEQRRLEEVERLRVEEQQRLEQERILEEERLERERMDKERQEEEQRIRDEQRRLWLESKQSKGKPLFARNGLRF